MTEFIAQSYDIAVIGAGHAGCEAALAAARLGKKTALFTISLDAVANMPCNPSIGGTAKGHIVREIDALGGEMGRIADKTMLQSRMLNRGKGPAVHSLRVQSDRLRYHQVMKQVVESTPNLDLIQAEVVKIETENGAVSAVVTMLGAIYPVRAVIIATGTYLKGKIFIGEFSQESGPDGCHPANALGTCLCELGLPMRRFKTGTPARVNRNSIDFSKLEVQPGDEEIIPFSVDTDEGTLTNKMVCHIGYTNSNTHEIIRANLHRSPMFAGVIEGVGPRYCPSIEDKVVRFSDKLRHQLFVEPMGEDTEEMYLQGVSSSLPFEVQLAFYHSITGLEQVKVMRPAYAIEYDCIDPLALSPSLMCKKVENLFGAGQFNGTSGYEEAAAQGLVAGINAVRSLDGLNPFVMARDESYIGTLIDDLTTKGVTEPYRMMTSRSEYRLLLRQDNAEARLTPKGREIGLISDARWQQFLLREQQRRDEIARLQNTTLSPTEELNRLLELQGTARLVSGVKMGDLLRRPQITYAMLEPFDQKRPQLPRAVTDQVEIEIKYAGYIQKQRAQAAEMQRLRGIDLSGIDFYEIKGLRIEAREKLKKVAPESLGAAMNISGVSPADISVLMLELSRRRRKGEEKNDSDR
ncbi:tRNA uridine-5-carboxymethylaminomethyl(34) synthesis enzyme MnmG [Oscillospiraceae bacterium LTW-04]|nr:tRNA uridine-5-carboxymethylaminomethyl(34) synthesis enzyme MnmG [Oscillospiraceae bacterium MB24-C1]